MTGKMKICIVGVVLLCMSVAFAQPAPKPTTSAFAPGPGQVEVEKKGDRAPAVVHPGNSELDPRLVGIKEADRSRGCDDCLTPNTDLGVIGTTVWGYTVSGDCATEGKWYASFTGEASMMYHFDLCFVGSSSFDADIKITDASCAILDGEDGNSGCGYNPDDFTWMCPSDGTYYVILAPYYSYSSHTCNGDATDTFTMAYYKDTPCDVPCPSGGIPEAEACGDDTNGGCNADPPVFEAIECDDTICGTIWTDGSTRDTDWYEVTVATDTELMFTMEAEFDVIAGLVEQIVPGVPGCDNITGYIASPYLLLGPCEKDSVMFCVPPGTYYLFVSHQDWPIMPCGTTNDYVATLTCAGCEIPRGACCMPNGTCVVDQTDAECVGMGGDWQGDGTDCDPNECPQPQGNDLCEDRVPVAVPSVTAGTTVNSTTDTGFPTCGSASITSPGVWYSVIGNGNTLTADLCNGATTWDTKLTVYCYLCEEPMCVDGNDDYCGLQSSVTWCSEAGTEYLILVHGYGGATGVFDLTISEGTACDDPPWCEPCDLECDPDSTPEGEPICGPNYDDVFNGGCNSDVPVYSPIACGDTVCGTSGTFLFDGGNYRDTDWYEFELCMPATVTWEVRAEFELLIFVVDAGSGNCVDYTILGSMTAGECETASLTFDVDAGTYWVLVMPSVFEGIPCGKEYEGTLTVTPEEACGASGGCCLPDGTCMVTCESDCYAQDGAWQGEGSDCSGAVENPACATPDATITIEIQTDSYGSETSWELIEQGVGAIDSGSGYGSYETHIIDVPVCSTSCYDFVCYDSYGDGIYSPYGYAVSYEGMLVYSCIGSGWSGSSETVPDIGGSCGGLGACCICVEGAGSCVVTTETCCEFAGGDFQGYGTNCGEFSYVWGPGDAFEDISGTGTLLSLSDDSGQSVPIGFNFTFWGDPKSQVAVCSNGYLTFGTDLTDLSEDPIPDTYDPNDIIAVMWDDLNPSSAGTVHYQTLGDAPNRRFIAQWTGVPQYANTDDNTFQAVLNEGTDCVELRYVSIGSLPGDFVAGVENADGTEGLDVSAYVSAGMSIKICPDVSGSPCSLCGALDIKPGSCPNSFNRKSHGVLSVALMSTEDLDVTMVDIATLRISRADGVGGEAAPNEGPPGPHTMYKDFATPFFGEETCECAALGADGIDDVSMKFKTDNVVGMLEMDDFPGGAWVELVVTGTLTDGTAFTASDCVRLVPPGCGPAQVRFRSNQAGAWIDVEPWDDTLDAGGFAEFERTYPEGTVVTATAPLVHNGKAFKRWVVDGVAQPNLVRSVVLTATDLESGHDVKALYRPGGHGGPVVPDPDPRQSPTEPEEPIMRR